MRAAGSDRMPRRKKNGQSPARVPGGPPENRGSLGPSAAYGLTQGNSGGIANNFSSSDSIPSSTKEKIVKSMQEMFSHLDPDVIYMLLSECDFKAENAMDSLLELSVAAEVTTVIPSPVSGFERTAALLSPECFPGPRLDSDFSKPSQQPSSSPPLTNLLTDELDQELETLNAKQEQCLSAGASLSSVPPPPLPQQPLPELLQSSLKPSLRHCAEWPCAVGDLVEHMPTSSPLNQPNSRDGKRTEGQHLEVDFTHRFTEMPAGKPKPPLDLAATGRPSAFQVYKKQDPSHNFSENPGVMPSDETVRGARSKVNVLNQEPFGYKPPSWNLKAPVFSPNIHGNEGPTFITPVAPSFWPNHTASHWQGHDPVSQAHLKPSATIPKSLALPTAPQLSRCNRLHLEGKVLVMLRGAPGSGKTTLARAFLEHNPGGIILSTDDYFTCHGKYQFNPAALAEAHEWNQKRAKDAFERGKNPIIIDNTNMQGWEMKPYVAQAQKHGYKVLFREPDTWWKNKPGELKRRTTHHVPVETIRRMLDGYDRFVTVHSIMGSHMPEWKQENQSSQTENTSAPCPDLVGEPGLSEGCKKSRAQLFSSLPDVSSIGRANAVGQLEDATYKSTESLNFHLTGRLTENPEISAVDKDLNLGELESELDAQLELIDSVGDQGIPDCIVESVMNEDHRGDEIPVAFSLSIGQRIRRERSSRRAGFDRMESADLVRDANKSETEAKEKEKTNEDEVEIVQDEEEKETPKLLHFVGDWPCEGSLNQREPRRRERQKETNGKENAGVSQEVIENKMKVGPGPDITKLQKVLDLIQTGGDGIQTCSSQSSPLSLSSEEEIFKEVVEGIRSEDSPQCKSNSEEIDANVNRVNNSRSELPDCVLDWKAADSCRFSNLRIDDSEEIKTEMEDGSTTGETDQVADICIEATNSLNYHTGITDDSTIAETNICHDEVGNHNNHISVGDVETTSCTEDVKESGSEADGSSTSEVCQSPMCEGSVEAEGSTFSGGCQERKQRQGRRSGKQCKLALTFTQNCPVPPLSTPENPSPSTQNIDCNQISMNTNDPSCNTSLNQKPNFDLFTASKLEAQVQPSSPPVSPADRGCSTQTEPQDFALLWRLNRHDRSTDCIHSSDFTVLSGDSTRFIPELSSTVYAAVAVHPFSHSEVLYHVVHEKGTQVEEKDLGGTQDRLESLCILSRHFKRVSFDTLEDLYDKCHQDLEWTTNLLLDSGEKFFKEEDDGKEEEDDDDGAQCEDDQNTSDQCGVVDKVVLTSICPDVSDESHSEYLSKGGPAGFVEGTGQSTCGSVSKSHDSSTCMDLSSVEGASAPVRNRDHSDTPSCPEKTPLTELSACTSTKERDNTDPYLEGGACGGIIDEGILIEQSRSETEEEIASMDEVHRLLQAELEELERQEKQRKKEKMEKTHVKVRGSSHLDIQSVELKLPTELALQLTELFGPVGVDPGACSSDDYAVQMDLNLAKLLHQKWKETIQERHRQATLSFHLLQESSVHWGESQGAKHGSQERPHPGNNLISANGYTSLNSQPEVRGQLPFMDHWNVSRPHVSLRDIIKEELALQKNVERTRQSHADLDNRDGATLLKENKLYSLFPTIDRHFLHDIFRDHNYSLTQTELFLCSLLDEQPVKTVVAPEAPQSDHHRAASKEREKRQKPLESTMPDYQDVEDPQYDDFRAEANLQRSRQLESFAKAAEAYKQGRKEVASFYAQQGQMHGQRMREANHRAAVQIFERVNSSLLPRNILDLHGLHVDEALYHLAQVLQDKTRDCEQGLCQPQLSVITGRGNHSQGGVARIRPAVIDYLSKKHYRFTEPKPGLMLVSLK